MQKKLNQKSCVVDLAIFSGNPYFQDPLYVGRPNIGNERQFLSRINDIFERKWLTNNGKYVQELEAKLSEFLGVKHCVAMCNGTIALEIAIKAAELKGEVIVPSFTFIATAHALQWQEITPVFCDVDPKTHNIDSQKIELMITPKTSGIIGTHVWGNPCDIENLNKIAKKHNLKLMFDAAHAFGCSYQGTMIGNFGNAEVFSFHATKFFNTFEGGAVTTNDDELAEKMGLMRNFGFAGFDNVIYLGTNGKMNEVSGAMGLTGLESLNEFIEINYRNYKAYQEGLKDVPNIHLFPYNEKEKCNYQYIVLEINESITKITRDDLVKILHAENIIARRYFYPGCHNMEPYRSYFPHSNLLLPETEKLTQKVIILPTGTSINLDCIEQICKIISLVADNATEIKQRLYPYCG